jgi:hypothetical protein
MVEDAALAGLGVDPAGGDDEHGGDVLGGEKVRGGGGGGGVLHSVLVSVALPRAGVSRPFLVVDQRRSAVPVKRCGRAPRERLTGAVAGASGFGLCLFNV